MDGMRTEGLAGVLLDAVQLVEHVIALQPDATVLVVDRGLRVVHAAGQLERHGWATAGDVVGRPIDQLMSAAMVDLVGGHYRAALAGEPRELEFVSPATGRSYLERFLPLRASPGVGDGDDGGTGGGAGGPGVPFALAVWVEHTEQLRLAADLAASERRFRELAERSSDVIIVFDRELRFRYVSPAMQRVAGWAPESLLGEPIPAFLHPDDLPAMAARVQGLFAGEEFPPSEFRLRRADGGWVWIEGVESPILDPATGEITALQATGRDIDERKRAEELFTALAELAPVGIFRADTAGNVLYVNPRWCEMAGITREQALAGAWLSAVHPDDRGLLSATWTAAVQGGERTGAPYRFLHADGTERAVVSTASPLRGQRGELLGYVGAVTDVTEINEAAAERLALESRLQQAQRLESLGVLAGGVAHDFNNLLVGVLGNAALALAELPESSPARHSIEQVETAARRAADLTRQMLAYSGRGRFAIERADLAAVVRETARLMQTTLPAGVRLQLDLPAGLPVVQGDITQLRQVVMNLVVNAGEAIDGPGVVAVSVSLADVGPETAARLAFGTEVEPGRYLALCVRDTGRGMDEATLERIFEPFFTTKFTGRGLGLAATLGIVRGHRGGVEVQTAPGQGTAFTVYLPPAAGAGADDEAAETGAPAGGLAGTVLVVDDDEVVTTVVRRMLESRGVAARTVADGAAALALVAAEPAAFSAVVLDLSLQGPGGEELLGALLAAGLAAPVVVTSGLGEQEVAAALAGRTVAGFLQKPFGIDELVAVLRGAVAQAALGTDPAIRSR